MCSWEREDEGNGHFLIPKSSKCWIGWEFEGLKYTDHLMGFYGILVGFSWGLMGLNGIHSETSYHLIGGLEHDFYFSRSIGNNPPN